MLYRHASADAVAIKAAVRLPAGCNFDSALHPQRMEGDTLFLPTLSLYTLVEPLFAGEYFRSIPLTQGAGSTRISIVADAPGDLAVSDAMIAGFKQLVPEAQALLGRGHYREYVWLIALGKNLDQQESLEHHESTDIRDSEALFTDPARMLEHRTITHEYVHSWSGKYRRPLGLATRNYQEPMVDDLLWVYEGTTRYLGDLAVIDTNSVLPSASLKSDHPQGRA